VLFVLSPSPPPPPPFPPPFIVAKRKTKKKRTSYEMICAVSFQRSGVELRSFLFWTVCLCGDWARERQAPRASNKALAVRCHILGPCLPPQFGLCFLYIALNIIHHPSPVIYTKSLQVDILRVLTPWSDVAQRFGGPCCFHLQGDMNGARNTVQQNKQFSSRSFRVVTPCSDVVGYQRFGGPCCFHLQGDMSGARK
jgi:hypothetical protein